ncbi:hypothetical protein [Aliarcobacter lanthieri]|uniref:hypothetical protein n=1 Tax=Aliarcobacter lanthieri TaxID=1355374 RepID=UPI000478BD52|nr:hypothetical protein [Aliarcobacter lanthieri]
MYKKMVLSLLFVMVVFSGCSYRNDSGISIPNNIETQTDILITENSLDDKSCIDIEKIDVSVKKLTVFHRDPTKEQADYVLSEKAKQLKANVVRNVKYSSGIGFTTWGYMDAEGDASKCDLD